MTTNQKDLDDAAWNQFIAEENAHQKYGSEAAMAKGYSTPTDFQPPALNSDGSLATPESNDQDPNGDAAELPDEQELDEEDSSVVDDEFDDSDSDDDDDDYDKEFDDDDDD